MKAPSRICLVGGMALLMSSLAIGATPPGDKRTILTSGEKVYTIKYQLGQSTVLYFGLRPETVICGNKNYFNIEKIKGGITIQPLSNFSTNLTVLAQGRRYLFYLTPARGRPDGFVEVKWIPTSQIKPLDLQQSRDSEIVRELNHHTSLSREIDFSILTEKILENGRIRIFEVELRNSGHQVISSRAFELVARSRGTPLSRQLVVWSRNKLGVNEKLRGRLIINGHIGKSLNLVIGYQGKSTKLIVKSTYD